jgi:hypothetical protein
MRKQNLEESLLGLFATIFPTVPWVNLRVTR